MEQVLVNVLVNAVQALDGQTRIQHEICVDVEVTDGEVIIRVSDTGVGTAEISRVFEPFYTTKSDGQGTGLGLSVCRRLIVEMNGRIELASTTGQGTTVTITLPRALLELETWPPAPVAVSWPRKRVLIVDDEPLVRRALADTLCEHHDVLEAEDGERALECIAAERPEVIVCDLMMPGMNGAEVYERVGQQFAGLERKIVFVTGGAFVPRLAEFLASSGAQVLGKPFDIEQVLATIARVGDS
jgi:CheY-like chemotaxis protein/anti-sigma regulatory factor (Ser/Thr protein kinase)